MGKSAKWYVDYAKADPTVAKKLIVTKARAKKRHALTAAAQDEFHPHFRKSLKAYLASGADVNALDGNGNRALCVAAFRAEPTLVTPLLEAGADPSVCDAHGYSPLRLAAQSWQYRAVEALLKAQAPVDRADGDGVTPLAAACTARNPPATVIQRLLANGADPEARAADGRPLLFHVARMPFGPAHPDQLVFADQAATAFVRGGGDVDVEGLGGRTLLHELADELRASRVEFWQAPRLFGGRDVTLTLWRGELSYELGGTKKLATLAQERRWAIADCPEHLTFCNAAEAVLGLLKLGANPNVERDGERPVHVLFEVGVPALVRAVVKAGGDATPPRADGVGCVLLGVRSGHVEPVAQALRAGADPNACGPDGVTALHVAAARGDLRLVRMLLRAGALPSRTLAASDDLHANESPADAATRGGHDDVVAALRA